MSDEQNEPNPYADRDPGSLTDEERAEIRQRIVAMLTPENVAKLRRITDQYVKHMQRRRRRRRVLRAALIVVPVVVVGLVFLFA